jgi:phosphoglycerol transferase MdoB-like AlkP superfamily enzyme
MVVLLFFSLIMRHRLTRKHFFAERGSLVEAIPLLEKISQNPLLSLAYSLSSAPVGRLLKDRMTLPQSIQTLEKHLHGARFGSQHSALTAVAPPLGTSKPLNVVVVLMESINMERMDSGFMPELQTIAAQGTLWSRFFASGVHTYAGIYSTLNSYPVQLRSHAMKWASDQAYPGLGTILADKGYETRFYTTHDEAFDNMGPFLRKNGFSRVVNLPDYDQTQVISTFGVPDHVMYDQALSELDDHGGERPFLAVLLSSSNHAPLRMPKGIPFEPKSRILQERLLEYSDWALGRFVRDARTRDWSDRTMFVFLGDHGASGDLRFPLPYSMVHIPLIMTGPGLSRGETVERLASQLDVMPSILGRLGFSEGHLGFGVDLFRAERSLALFCSDDSLGCTDGRFYAVFDFDRIGALYRITDDRPRDLSRELAQRFGEMKKAALAHWRMADWLVENRRTLAGPLR